MQRPMLTTCLLASTALAVPLMTATAAETTTGLSEPRPFDTVTNTRAIREMAVVNPEGQNIGSIEDIIVDFGDRTVLYALLRLDESSGSGTSGQQESDQQAGEQASGESETPTPEEEQAGEQASGESETPTAEKDQAVAEASADEATSETRFYPIPIEALQIAERSQPEDAGGSQDATASNKQQQTAGETAQQTAEAGAEDTAGEATEGAQAMAEGAGSGQEAAEGGGSQAEQQTAGAGQEGMAAGSDGSQTQTASSLQDLAVGEIIGMPVRGADGEEISSVDAVVTGLDDTPVAVMGVGGFLGIGEKIVGLQLNRLELASEGEGLIADVTREQLENAPDLDYAAEQEIGEDVQLAELMQTGEGGAATADSRQQADQVEPAAGPAEGEEQQAEGEQAQAEGEQAEGEQAQTEGEQAEGEQAQAEGEQAQGEQQQAAESGEASGQSLEGMVLVVDLAPEDLRQAPSFTREGFPDMADAEWHQTVLGFYATLLQTPMEGVEGQTIEPAAGPREGDDTGAQQSEQPSQTAN